MPKQNVCSHDRLNIDPYVHTKVLGSLIIGISDLHCISGLPRFSDSVTSYPVHLVALLKRRLSQTYFWIFFINNRMRWGMLWFD